MLKRVHSHALVALLGIGVTLAAPRAHAHHAFSAEFDINKPIQLKGTLTKVEWVNPHSWIYVDVPDESGNVTHWAVEFGAPAALRRRGFSAADFPTGIEVTVNGYLAKSGKEIVNAKTVVLPDGRDLYAGDDE